MNYEDIRAGMTLLEPIRPGGYGGRGPALRAIRHDPRWGQAGAWICRDVGGRRVNVWPGIAHMYQQGDARDWDNSRNNARQAKARA